MFLTANTCPKTTEEIRRFPKANLCVKLIFIAEKQFDEILSIRTKQLKKACFLP